MVLIFYSFIEPNLTPYNIGQVLNVNITFIYSTGKQMI